MTRQKSKIRNVLQIILIIAFLLSSFLIFSRKSSASVSKTINYQGRLTDASGVNKADGSYNMILSIYTASSGGTPVWTARGTTGSPTARSVAVSGGIFSIALGDTGAGDNAMNLDFNGTTYYLGVTVGADVEMTPRKQLTSVPQAFNANNLAGDGYVDLDNTSTAQDLLNITYNPSSGTNNAAVINYGSGGGTGTALNVSQAGTGFALRVNDDGTLTDTTPFVVDASGNVGIGTTAPGYKLDISGGDMRLATAGSRYRGSDANTFLQFSDYARLNAADVINFYSGSSNNSMQLAANGDAFIGGTAVTTSPTLTAKATGSVGIGTTNPTSKLSVLNGGIDVSGTTNANGWFIEAKGSSISGGFKPYGNNVAMYAYRGQFTTVLAGDASGLNLVDDSGTAGNGIFIQDGGNVGIGTTNPQQKLDVSGSERLYSTSGSGRMYFWDSSQALDEKSWRIYSESNKQFLIQSAKDDDSSADTALKITRGTGVAISSVSLKNDTLFINSSNNVGIGTTNPGVKLDVGGVARVSGAVVINSALQDAIRIQPADDNNPTYNIITLGNSAWNSWPFSVQKNGNMTVGAISAPTSTNTINNLVINSGALSGITTLSMNNQLTNSYANTAAINLTGNGAGITFTGTGPNQIITASGVNLALMPGGSGNVGIGTTAPDDKLHIFGGSAGTVNSTTNSLLTIENNNQAFIQMLVPDATDASSGLIIGDSGNAYETGLVYNPTTGLTTYSAGAFYTKSGNVGIGTTNPLQPLDVNGNLAIAGSIRISSAGKFQAPNGTAAAPSILFSNDSDTGFYYPAVANNLGIITGGNELIRLTSTSVGIGTTNPGAALEVNGQVKITGGTPGSNKVLTSDANGLASWTTLSTLPTGNADTVDNIHVGTINQNYMVKMGAGSTLGQSILYDNGTNVGIGTTNPGAKLEIASNSGNIFQAGVSANDWGGNFAFGIENNNGIIFSKAGAANNTTANRVAILTRSDTNGANLSLLTEAGNAGILLKGNGDSYFKNGNIGIGTTTPNAKLQIESSSSGAETVGLMLVNKFDVDGTKATLAFSPYNDGSTATSKIWAENIAGGDYALEFGSWYGAGLTEQMRILGSGKVGIGTTAPGQLLDVNGTARAKAFQDDGYQGTFSLNNGLLHLNNTYNVAWSGTTSYAGTKDINISRGAAGKLFVGNGTQGDFTGTLAAGNIGIGTTSPASLLQLYGATPILTISDSDTSNNTVHGEIRLQNSGTTLASLQAYRGADSAKGGLYFNTRQAGVVATAMTIDNNGYVGIGTTAPTSKLEVNGNIQLTSVGNYLSFKSDDLQPIIHTERTDGSWDYYLRQNGWGGFSIDRGLGLGGYDPGQNTGLWVTGTGYFSGNVGIGTTGPAYKLDVNGDARLVGDLYVNGSDVLLSQNGSGYATVGLQGTASGLYVGVNLKNDGAKQSDAAVAWRSQYVNTADAYYIERSAAGTSAWTQPFMINSNGNIGIGTTAPGAYKLYVASGNTYLNGTVTGTSTISATTGYQVNGAAASGSYLRGNGTNFVSGTIPGSDVTGAALSKTDDTNVTLTLGGTPGTALLRSASMTLGWTGQLSIARGGTNGTAAPTAGAIAYGNGTSYVFSGTGAAGQVLVSGGAGAPTWSNASGGTVTAISVASANGFAGTSSGGATPQLTLSTTVTGMLKGNGTAISAATSGTDYIAGGVGANHQIAYFTGSGALAGSNGFWFDGTNIGIGTTSPSSQLDIRGSSDTMGTANILFGAANASSLWDIRTGHTIGDLAIDRYASGIWSNAMTILTASGNVGIGTTNPGTKLQLEVAGDTGLTVNAASATQSIDSYIALQHNGTQKWVLGNDGSDGVNSDSFKISYSTGNFNSTGLTILSSGNVGIGTTAPATGAKLHVLQSIYNYDDLTVESALPSIRLADNENNQYAYGILVDGSGMFIDSYTYANRFANSYGNHLMYFSGGNVWMGGTSAASSPTLVAQSGGNVGIGTTNPTSLLHLNKPYVASGTVNMQSWDTNTAGYNLLLSNTNDSSGIRWDFVQNNASTAYNVLTFRGGNVGIGTTTPSTKLHVYGGSLTVGAGATPNVATTLIGADGNASGYLNLIYDGTTKVHLSSGSASGSSYFNGGNVGIGTTNPTAYLMLKAGTSTAGAAPLKFTAGTNLASAEAGAMEWDGTSLYITQTSGPTRKTIAYTDSTNLPYLSNSTSSTQNGYFGNIYLQDDTNPSNYLAITVANDLSSSHTLSISTSNADRTLTLNNNFTVSGTLTDQKFCTYTTASGLVCNSDSSAFSPWTDSGTVVYLGSGGVASTDNVGIGTTNPAAKLQVNGSSFPISNILASFMDTRATGQNYGGGIAFMGNYNPGTGDAPAYWGYILGQKESSTATNYAGFLSFYTAKQGVGSGPDEKMRIDSNGDVGIGTTNPGAKLQITSSAVASGYQNWLKLSYDDVGTADYTIYRNNATGFLDFTGSQSGYTGFTFNGNVGIGTTAPENKLTLKDVSGAVYYDVQAWAANNAGLWMRYQNSATAGTQIYYEPSFAMTYLDALYAYSAGTVYGSFNFRTKDSGNNLASRLFIRGENGNVGIGTTNPLGILHVSSPANGRNIWFGNPLDSSTWVGNVNMQGTADGGTGLVVYPRTAASTAPASITQFIKMSHYGTTDTGLVSVGASSNFAIATGLANSTSSWSVANVKLFVQNGGNVGIGTTSPNAKLDVQGAIRIGHGGGPAGYQFTEASDDTYLKLSYYNTAANEYTPNILATTYDGKVGIGTTSPKGRLHVSNGDIVLDNAFSLDALNTSGAAHSILFGDSANNIILGGASAGWNSVYLWPNSIAALVAKSDGHVGINTDTISYGTLQVTQLADTETGGLSVYTPNSVPTRAIRLWVDSAGVSHLDSGSAGAGVLDLNAGSGNVGIHTTAPTFDLDIVGTLRASGNVRFGSSLYLDGGYVYMANGLWLSFYDNVGSIRNVMTMDANNNLFVRNVVGPIQIGASTLGVCSAATGAYNTCLTHLTQVADNLVVDGNIGVGVTSPAAKLQVRSLGLGTAPSETSGLTLENTTAATSAAGNQQYSPLLRFMGNGWRTNATAASRSVEMTIGLKTIIGTANPTGELHFYSSINNAAYTDITTLTNAGVWSAPDFCATTGGAMCLSGISDSRLKTNITPMSSTLDRIIQLRPVTYDWNDTYKETHSGTLGLENIQLGFIAQDVAQLFPEVIHQGSDGYYGIDYMRLTPIIVKGMQEQQQEIQQQGGEIASILGSQSADEKKMSSMDSDIAYLKSQVNQMGGTSLATLNNQMAAMKDAQQLLGDQISQLTSTDDNLAVKLADQNSKTDYLGSNFNDLYSRVNELSRQLAGLSTPSQEENGTKIFYDFSEISPELSTSLSELQLSGGEFTGKYTGNKEYQEISIHRDLGLDMSDYDIEKGYLTFDVYMEDADLTMDFVTELGNQMDVEELQWNKPSHPFFLDGWNKVELPISDAMKTGQVDWTKLDYMRVYFKFAGEHRLGIRNIRIEAPKKAAVNNNSLAFNNVTYDLSDPEGQKAAIQAIASQLGGGSVSGSGDSGAGSTDMNSRLSTLEDQMKLLQEQNQSVIDFAKAIDTNSLVYKDSYGSIDLGNGKLEASGVVAGAFTVKVDSDSSRTVGKGTISAVKKDADMDGIDDDTMSDGKSVVIKTTAVTATSKIFISPKSKKALKTPLTITEQVSGDHFKVEIPDPASEDIDFDWWIVEEQ